MPSVSDAELIATIGRRMGRNVVRPSTTIAVYDTIELGKDRRTRFHHVRQVIRADDDGVDGILCWLEYDGPHGTPHIAPEHNCTLGMLVTLQERGQLACDLRFPHALSTGEIWSFSYMCRHEGPRPPMHEWHRTCMSRFRTVHAEVHFCRTDLPRHIEVWSQSGDHLRTEISTSARSAVLTRQDFGPGTMGLRWAW
ncbi:hypothetical protein KEM60_03104 [Austwickia sp. TVS 96-490-7B]|nr:hypothetical protein [Austwickia sp. TVS 96-490-7B]